MKIKDLLNPIDYVILWTCFCYFSLIFVEAINYPSMSYFRVLIFFIQSVLFVIICNLLNELKTNIVRYDLEKNLIISMHKRACEMQSIKLKGDCNENKESN